MPIINKGKYITQVKTTELIKFFKDNGYELAKLTDCDGKKIPSIERGYTDVFVRCRNIEDHETMQKIKAHMLKRNPFLTQIMTSGEFSDQIEAIMLKDFSLTRIAAIDFREDKLAKAYINFMYDKFGEEYREDYNNYVRSLRTKER